MQKKCLLLQFPNQNKSEFREVFTEEKNEKIISEFVKTFGLKVFLVEADDPKLLNTDELVSYLCNQYEKSDNCKYYKTKEIEPNNSRNKMLQTVCDIRVYIENQLKEGNTLRIKELYQTLSPYNIGVSTIYRHLSFVKNKLKKEGKNISKVMVGCYKII